MLCFPNFLIYISHYISIFKTIDSINIKLVVWQEFYFKKGVKREIIQNIPQHNLYANVPLYVIMPNHIHLIMVIDGDKTSDNVGTRFIASVNENDDADAMNRVPTGGITGNKNPMLNETLGTVVRGLKARVTKFANQNQIIFSWQTRFHDHIIRKTDEMNRIAEYIETNVLRWESDGFYG